MRQKSFFQRRFERLQADVDSGKVQDLVDAGWTILQLAEKYEVSEHHMRRQGKTMGGTIDYRGKRGKREETYFVDQWSDAKKLAVTGKW